MVDNITLNVKENGVWTSYRALLYIKNRNNIFIKFENKDYLVCSYSNYKEAKVGFQGILTTDLNYFRYRFVEYRPVATLCYRGFSLDDSLTKMTDDLKYAVSLYNMPISTVDSITYNYTYPSSTNITTTGTAPTWQNPHWVVGDNWWSGR